jgi:hypothetical protein
MIALPLASFDPSLLRSSLEWQPKHHIHYSSRACDVDDDLPKVYNLPLAGLSAFVNYPPPPPLLHRKVHGRSQIKSWNKVRTHFPRVCHLLFECLGPYTLLIALLLLHLVNRHQMDGGAGSTIGREAKSRAGGGSG